MAMQQEALEAIRKSRQAESKDSVFTLRGKNESLGPSKDLAHEGFGTYEDKFSESPLIGELPTRNVIRQEMMQYILPNRTSTRRCVLSKKFLSIGAEFDVTNEILNDKIPLIEIESVHFLYSDESVIEIETILDGYNSGRIYHLRPPPSSLHGWIEQIRDQVEKARAHETSYFRRFRKFCKRMYSMSVIQNLVALLIIGNFVAIATESQVQPARGSNLYNLMRTLDIVFTILFTVEIILNAFAHWFWPFVMNYWNLLDVIVVGFSLITLSDLTSLDVLKPTRAFRIFRLAGKVTQLRRIVNAVSQSVIPMANAFFLGLIMTSIFAILGTEFYKDGDQLNFGTFSRTFNTLWSVIAFQTWDTAMPVFRDDGSIDFGVLGFLLALVFVLVWIMLQVVVATLLDHFVSATAKAFQGESMAKLDNAVDMNIDTGGLEPLLSEVIKLFDTSDQISRGFKKLFHKFDYDRTGRIDYVKLREGLKKINTAKRINLSEEDFAILVENGKMCFEDRTINLSQWDRIMRKQMKMHVQRDLTDVMALYDDVIEMRTLLASHRILHLNDPTEYVRKIQDEKEMFLRDIALFKKKLQTDVNILIGLQSNLIRRTANDISSPRAITAELNSWESEELLERAQNQDEEIAKLRDLVASLQKSVEQNTKAVTAASTARNTPFTGNRSPLSHHGGMVDGDLLEASNLLKPQAQRGHFTAGNTGMPVSETPARNFASGDFGPAAPMRNTSSLESAPRRIIGIGSNLMSPSRVNGDDSHSPAATSSFISVVPKPGGSKIKPMRSETVAKTSRGVTAPAAIGLLGFPSEYNSDRSVGINLQLQD